MPILIRVLITLQASLLAACSSITVVENEPLSEPAPASLQAERPARAWWQLRFKLAWPEGEVPDFSRHLLIAEQLVLPVIVGHEQQLTLWRIHRRSARDSSGNQFSLIFYSDEATAEQINEEVRSDPLTQWLIEQSMLENTSFLKRTTGDLGRLEQTSDREWPMEIQRSWPYFIMGVSQTWLMQVQEISQGQALAGRVSYEELLAHYQRVDETLDAQWEEFGQHAYLHHLNAVFGYQPLRIRGTVLRRF